MFLMSFLMSRRALLARAAGSAAALAQGEIKPGV